MTKPENIEKKAVSIRAEIAALNNKIEAAEQASRGVKKQLDEIASAVSSLRQALYSINRRYIEYEIEKAEKLKQPIIEEITKINNQLDNIRKTIVDNAKIVGATVTKLYLSPQMFSSFDVVIVDEASMVLLPAMYHAAGLAKEKVIVSGDFRQLAPIVTTNQKAIFDEIGSNVFHAAKVDETNTKTSRRVMLVEQYRMDDKICKLISNLMYDGNLKTVTRSEEDKSPCKTPPKKE